MHTLHAALQTTMRLVAAAMGAVYFVGGLSLLLLTTDPLHLGPPLRIALGVLLMLYGFYRLIRGTRPPMGKA